MTPTVFYGIVVLIYGIVIGSFLNVCIYRIPKEESIAKSRSHCMNCGYQLKWYDLVPIFSYLFLGGKCRKCKQKISIQYPLIEGLNGGLYLLIYAVYGVSIETLLYCLLFSALIVISVIDFRTYIIPDGIVLFILALGLIRVITDYTDWLSYGIGLLSVSVPLELIRLITKGRGMGGGDVKLMAVCGLLLGWKLTVLAFALGCIIGSIVHLIRMRVTKADHMLALGPYLALGLMIATLWGEKMLQWYFNVFM
ncbi:MAG: prepilin peptidase [Lachnospiraceae bacterium]|nr:prepilin peptidase [Lachnospiraceae bacterium]